MRILLDAGHGGDVAFGGDPGAIGIELTKESKTNLDVILMLGMILEQNGQEVLYTRTSDVYISPSQRTNIINSVQPDIFISVHCNSSDNPSANGIEALYRDDNDKDLAINIQTALVDATGLKNRGVKNDVNELHRKLAVLSGLPQVAACLVEIGFISNAIDFEMIKNTELIAGAIAQGAMA